MGTVHQLPSNEDTLKTLESFPEEMRTTGYLEDDDIRRIVSEIIEKLRQEMIQNEQLKGLPQERKEYLAKRFSRWILSCAHWQVPVRTMSETDSE